MSLPYFPMYPTDFEAKTSHLTLAEDGAYNRLLRLMWMTSGCTLPADDAWIMRRMRVDQDTYDTVVCVVIAEFFTVENGRLSNAKLGRIFAETNEAHQRRVSAGSKGGKAKSLNSLAAASSNAKAMPKQPEPEPEPYKKESTNVLLPVSGEPIDDVSKAVTAYNEAASQVDWPSVQKLSPARRAAIKARLRECGGMTGWEVALSKASASSFLTGRTDRPFRLTFDFLTKATNFTKIMEGNYDDRSNPNSNGNGNSSGRRGSHDSLMAGFAAAANSGRS